jgi:hypothetical protein
MMKSGGGNKNRFDGIVDLGFVLWSLKNQGVWVEELEDLDEFSLRGA